MIHPATEVHINGCPLTWRFKSKSPKPILATVSGLNIINPLFLRGIKNQDGTLRHPSPLWIDFDESDHPTIETNNIYVLNTWGTAQSPPFQEISLRISAFLCWCRILASQSSMATEPIAAGMIFNLNFDDSTPLLPCPPREPNGGIHRSHFKTAITEEIAQDAAQKIHSGQLAPSHLHHMVSAIGAIERSDYHSGYILATTAIESCAKQGLESLFDDISKQHGPQILRMSPTVIRGGTTVYHDPVWRYLYNDRTPFKSLLHELPFYLGKGSLLIEDKGLYDRALKLYKTRNDLVHSGKWQNEEKVYHPVHSHGNVAIQAALDVMTWFEPHPVRFYPPGSDNFIERRSVTWAQATTG